MNVDNFLNLPQNSRLCMGFKLSVLTLCALLVRPGLAGEWYLGVGAGVSSLKPALAGNVAAAESTRGTYAGFMLGKSIGDQWGAELHLHLPGRGEIGNADVDYSAIDLALRYGLINFSTPGALGTDVFVLGGFGSVERDAEGPLELENDTRFHFSVGLGAETLLNPSVSLRAQGLYIDEDVQVANVSLIWRWGPASDTGLRESATALSKRNTANRKSPGRRDSDGDGVLDANDACDGSVAGFPVRKNGCALFNGLLSGVTFEDQSSTLNASAYVQLDALVDQLIRFPDAAIELNAHTDNRGSLREQSILTRKRLRIIASYMSKNGIRGNRLVLRSMGGSQPVFDNSTAKGRAGNNRIEIFEHTF